MKVELSQIEEARRFLSQYLEPTPLLKNEWLSQMLGCDLYLKLENTQPIGSFKIRGATYRISKLSAKEKKKGVICASAGNHAQGVAWGSKKLGVKATIVMPVNAPLVKVQNTQALGAEVILDGNSYDEAFAKAKAIAKKTGKIYIHAFEDHDVIAGQGTVGLEILDQLPQVDYIIGSIGGGGLLAGIATVMKAARPQTKIIGCQADGALAVYKSFKTGKTVRLDSVNTIADGIAVKQASGTMVDLLKKTIDDIAHVPDETIAEAMLMLLEKAKTVAEASGAITLAVAEKMKAKLKKKKVVLIISGGNVDVNILGRVIDRGLIKAGRRLRVNVNISDIPGSLSRLTALLAQHGASVIQAIHDRNELSMGFQDTMVELTLETRGHEHSKAVLNALKQAVSKIDVLH